jgi:hypothetical protein
VRRGPRASSFHHDCPIEGIAMQDEHRERDDTAPIAMAIASKLGGSRVTDLPPGRFVPSQPQEFRGIAQADVHRMPLVLMAQSNVSSGSQA